MTDAPLLEAKGIIAGYDRGPNILNGADLTVNSGQILCIIGPNGAGKSTLLKTIAGLLNTRAGEIICGGIALQGLRPDQVIRHGICLVPQERALFPNMTVRENLRMGGYALENQHLISERIEDVMTTFPILKDRAKQFARSLSGGEQQMLAMGRCLVLQPQIVMLDEPSLGLAPKVVRQMFNIIHMLRERGLTIITVEQNAVMGLENADWGCVLDLGKTLFEGPANEILQDERIRELYLGKQATTR